jgi:hypothetical protein
MKALRILGLFSLALALAVGLPACAKKNESQVSMTDTSMTSENPATMPESPPPQAPPQTTPPPAATNHVGTRGTTHRTGTSSNAGSATNASSRGGRTISLPTGSTFDVETTTPISTKTSNVGDKVEAKLLQPLTSADGATIAEAGALIRGEISELTRASHAKSEDERASLKLAFTSLETVDGEKSLSATVTNSEGRMVAKSTSKRDALIIGGSAVAGAVAGKIIGGDTKGAVIGAVGGAVAGTGVVMAKKGYELEIPAGSKITLRSEAPVTVVAR